MPCEPWWTILSIPMFSCSLKTYRGFYHNVIPKSSFHLFLSGLIQKVACAHLFDYYGGWQSYIASHLTIFGKATIFIMKVIQHAFFFLARCFVGRVYGEEEGRARLGGLLHITCHTCVGNIFYQPVPVKLWKLQKKIFNMSQFAKNTPIPKKAFKHEKTQETDKSGAKQFLYHHGYQHSKNSCQVYKRICMKKIPRNNIGKVNNSVMILDDGFWLFISSFFLKKDIPWILSVSLNTQFSRKSTKENTEYPICYNHEVFSSLKICLDIARQGMIPGTSMLSARTYVSRVQSMHHLNHCGSNQCKVDDELSTIHTELKLSLGEFYPMIDHVILFHEMVRKRAQYNFLIVRNVFAMGNFKR
ncbi:putative signal peptide protein [Puccinia sorghi]|uniref:Putative signal peptide protein n=1 Tax=Puccinia sorghi TaxID=27349 RepID=A0A0L6U5L0_9BASI|nr:putative signal peptide protein [Puccinia sorghi]